MPRFFGLDIHKQYLEIAAVDNQGKLLFNERVAIDDLARWAAEHLTQDDAAVLEAGLNTWWVYDTLKPHVGRVVVANPLKTRLIAEARIKTDRLSAEALARLLQANFICEVWVPDEQTREQRALVSHRVFLSRNSTRFKNRIHSVLHRYQLRMPQGLNLFSPTGKDWLLAQKLSDFDRLQVENCFDLLFSLQQSQKKADKALALAAKQDKRAAILMQIPGLGFHAALAILSQIGDIRRFANAKKLCSYAGLVPRVYSSGQKEYTGSITKAGRSILRWILVEAAHTTVRYDPELGKFFRRLEKKKGGELPVG